MKKRVSSFLLALCLALGLAPAMTPRSAAADFEQAWYPASRMYLVQIAYESGDGASHKDYNTIDIANTTDLKAAEKRVFAPFTGIIVYRNTKYGYVLLQSKDKVRYADGTEDYMTVGFMHDNDISDLPLGKVIRQGEAFYDAGNTSGGKIQEDMGYHVQISVFKGQFFSVSAKKDSYTVGKQLRKFKNGKLSPGDVYAFDAFSVNTDRTKANKYTEVGCLAKGHTVAKKGAPEDWSGRWKDLSGNPFPAPPTISDVKTPGALKAGGSFSPAGKISSKTKITAVTAGVFTAETGGTMKAGKTVNPSPAYKSKTRVTSYSLAKLGLSVKASALAAGTYWYRVTATTGAGVTVLVNSKFTVGSAAAPSTTKTPARQDPPKQDPPMQNTPAQNTPAQQTTPQQTTPPRQNTPAQQQTAPAAGDVNSPKYPVTGWYTLTPACAPDLRLDVAYSGTSSEDTVWTWEANGTPAQLWYVHPNQDTDRYYNIRAGVDIDLDMVLDVQYGGLTSGTSVWQYEANGSQAQDWMFLDAGGGYYYIVPRENQDLTLAVKDGSAEECGELIVETRTGSSGQKWLLTKYG